jgi:ribose transport system permease protein
MKEERMTPRSVGAPTRPAQAETDRVDAAPAVSGSNAEPAVEQRHRPRINLGFDRFSGVYTFVAIIIIFGLWVPDLFLQVSNLKSILAESAITGMMAMAILIPLAAGAYDLSIGGVMSVSMVLVAWLQSVQHWAPIPALLVAIGVSLFIGVLNGVSVVFLRVNSFIATLAMSSILAAVELAISGGNQIVTGISTTFISAGQDELFGIALPVYYLAGLALVLYFVLEHTPFGRYLFAVGDNVDATRLSGVRTGRLTFYSLMISATIAGIAGVVLCARVGSYSVNAGGAYLLPAFAAAFLGSTQLKPGRMNVWGTVLAVYLLATGVDGLSLAGAADWVSQLFNGLALLIAVSAAMFGARRRRAA